MKATFKIFLRPDNQNIDGTNTLYLLFTSRRKLKKISLGIKVHLKDWNEKKCEVKKSDKEFLIKNKYIQKYDQKAKDIINKYFFEDKFLSVNEFERQFKNESFGSTSFYEFVENEVKTSNFSDATIEDYRENTKKLKEFKPELSFSEIDLTFIQEYEQFLVQRGNRKNTRANSKKFLKQIINKAIKKGITEDTPFKFIKVEKIEGNMEHLTRFEIDKLKKLIDSDLLSENQNYVLKYFLFACYTGVRFKDFTELKYKHIEQDKINGEMYKFLVFDMHKTGKPVDIPIIPFVEQFLINGLPNQKLFNVFTSQSTNRHLKKIMKLAGIAKKISFHCARHTLGNIGADVGINREVISAILGHTNISTTQIYSKVPRSQKVIGLEKMHGEDCKL
jgi:site-specific recombinase XerD